MITIVDGAAGPLSRPLTEQRSAGCRVVHAHPRRLLYPDMHAFVDGRSRQHAIEPTLEMRKLGDVLSLPLPAARPTDARHVSDRIGAGEEIPIGQTAVHDAVESIAF